MKRFFLILLALVSLLPVQAKVDAGQLLGGLIQIVSEPQPAAPEQTKEPGLGEQIMLTLRGATDAVMESYKEEGREYAREVGDIITERILESRKISDTLDSMRIFCWAVVAYLTIVTILIVVLLLRLRVLYSKLMKAIQGLPSNK
jgi:hypothetical protein